MVQHGLHTFRSFRPKIRYSCCSICPSGMQVRNPSRLPKQEQKMLGQGFLGTWREPMMITDAFLPLFVSIGQGGIQWPRPYRHWWLWLDQPPEHKHPPGRWSKPSPRAQWLEPRWSGQQTCHRCWWRRGGKIWRPSLRPVQESTVPTAPHRVPKLSLSWSLFGSLVVRLAGPLTLSELGGKQTETASQGRAKQNRPKELTWSGSPSSLQEPGAFEDIRGLVLVGDVLVGFSYLGDPNTQANTQASLHAMFAMFCSSKTILLLSSFLICLICFGLKGEQSQGIGGRARSRPQVLKDLDVGEGSCPLIQAPRRQAVREDRHGKTASELSKDHECHLAENPQNTSKFESKCKICGINSCLCAPILELRCPSQII